MDTMRPVSILITCEHAGCDVPAEYAHLFAGAAEILRSHRGWDPGAIEIARELAARLDSPLLTTSVTRLLVEVNRSLGHPQLFSEFSSRLTDDERADALRRFYRPHRTAVEQRIVQIAATGTLALHVAVHSFVDSLNGVERRLDIGLLFDPARRAEAALCDAWRRELQSRRPELRVRFNEPYLGTDDGLTRDLRTRFDDHEYAGVEVEIRQGLLSSADAQSDLAMLLADSLAATAASCRPD